MFTFDLEPMLEYKRRHKQLVKEASEYRLVKDSQKADQAKVGGTAKILASIGKELVNLGTHLEERYGPQPEAGIPLNRQSHPDGC